MYPIQGLIQGAPSDPPCPPEVSSLTIIRNIIASNPSSIIMIVVCYRKLILQRCSNFIKIDILPPPPPLPKENPILIPAIGAHKHSTHMYVCIKHYTCACNTLHRYPCECHMQVYIKDFKFKLMMVILI